MDQYASQFLMRGGIGPSQADGNPALPEVLLPHCLSAGYQGFAASLGQQRPKRRLLLLHQMDFIQIFTFAVVSVFAKAPLTRHPTFLKDSIQTGLEKNDPVLDPTPLLANHNYQNPAFCTLAQLCSSKHSYNI